MENKKHGSWYQLVPPHAFFSIKITETNPVISSKILFLRFPVLFLLRFLLFEWDLFAEQIEQFPRLHSHLKRRIPVQNRRNQIPQAFSLLPHPFDLEDRSFH